MDARVFECGICHLPGALPSCGVFQVIKQMPKFEYHVVYVEVSDSVTVENALGAEGIQGWELVSTTLHSDPEDDNDRAYFTCFFKRPSEVK